MNALLVAGKKKQKNKKNKTVLTRIITTVMHGWKLPMDI